MADINWDEFEPVDETPVATEEMPTQDAIDWSQFDTVGEQEKKEPPKPKKGPANHPLAEWMRQKGATEEEIAQASRGFAQAEGSKQAYKALASGVTAGFSEFVPGLETEPGGITTAGKVIGSVLPISALAKGATAPLVALANKSPVLANQLRAAANLLGIATAGGILGGLEEASEGGKLKLPSVNNMLEHGAEWALLDAGLQTLGWGGRFTKALLNKAKSLGKPAEEVLESTIKKIGTGDHLAEKAIAELEGKSFEQITKEVNATDKAAMENFAQAEQKQAADLRNRKIEQKDFKKLEDNMAIQVKPYLPAEFEAEKIAETAISEDLTQKIESISERAATERELGQNIQRDLEAQIDAAKAETDALYEEARLAETVTAGNLDNTAGAIVNQLKKLEAEGIKLTPEGYATARHHLTQLLEDVGYKIVRDEEGAIKEAIHNNSISHSKLLEVKKRLNKIINYDLLETGAQDLLKEPAALIRENVRRGYGNKKSPARQAFEKAEKKFGEFAEKRGKKSITAMRYSEKPESIAKTIKTPSGLADVKDIVTKEQFAQIERELLEHMRAMNEERAAKFYREMRPSMTPDARSVAEEIIASKAPPSSPTRKVAQRAKIQDMVLDDISKATITGERPQKVLDLWKTKEGQQLIKHTLEDNPNKKEILKYLSEQSFRDFEASVISPDGVLNFKKLNNMLRDPATAENIRLVAGEEGLNFLKNLEQLSKRFERNKSFLEGRIDKASIEDRKKIMNEFEQRGQRRFKEGKQRREALSKEQKLAEEAKEKAQLFYKLDDWFGTYGWKAKGVLAALGIFKIGLFPAAGIAVTYDAISALAKNKKVRDLFKKASGPRKDPVHIIQAFDAFMRAEDEA